MPTCEAEMLGFKLVLDMTRYHLRDEFSAYARLMRISFLHSEVPSDKLLYVYRTLYVCRIYTLYDSLIKLLL